MNSSINVFADRILDILNNNNIRKRFIINSLDVVKNYSMDKICDSFIDLYNSLLLS